MSDENDKNGAPRLGSLVQEQAPEVDGLIEDTRRMLVSTRRFLDEMEESEREGAGALVKMQHDLEKRLRLLKDLEKKNS